MTDEKYYSQYLQDKFMNEIIFNRKKTGYFIDVGAHNGIDGSNSKFFEELGWTGICVEPIATVFEQLKKNRTCIAEKCLAYNENKMVEFRQCTGYTEMLSGIVETYPSEHENRLKSELMHHGGSVSKIMMPAFTLNYLLERHNAPIDIDFLSIDTEGSELQVLQGVDLKKWKIKVIDVENNFKHLFAPIDEYLKANGYKHFKTLGGDEIYVRE